MCNLAWRQPALRYTGATDPMAQRVTELLLAWGDGDVSALDQLIPLVHAELRHIAARYMARERRGHDLLALDDALDQLGRVDERQSQIVVMRFFAGLTVEEIAGVLGVSTATVMRDWKLAKSWLLRELDRTKPEATSR